MTSIIDLFGSAHPHRRISTEKNIERTSRNKPVEKGKSTAKAVQSETDRVKISDIARNQLMEKTDVDKYLGHIHDLVRLDEKSLRGIKDRIKTGYYEKPEVVSKILADIVRPSPDPDQIERSDLNPTAFAGNASLEKIRAKIESGDYFADDVTENIAAKMIDPDYI